MMKKALGLLLALFSAWAMAAVDVNTASPADLDSIKGIGPGTTETLLAARKSGAFKDWNDLIERVKGMGPSRAAKLSDQGLRVNGAPYGAAKAASEKPPVAEKPAKPPKG